MHTHTLYINLVTVILSHALMYRKHFLYLYFEIVFPFKSQVLFDGLGFTQSSSI